MFRESDIKDLRLSRRPASHATSVCPRAVVHTRHPLLLFPLDTAPTLPGSKSSNPTGPSHLIRWSGKLAKQKKHLRGQGNITYLTCSNPCCAGFALATRGPPQKPKQSEPSLWVGGLPTGVRIEDVRDHSSQGATEEIVSVFLMKSNSAIMSYRTRVATISAVQRFGGSRMSGGPCH